jgi:pyochelin biosynthetic protein PchC
VALRICARPSHRLRGVVLSAQPSPRHFVPAGLHQESDDALWTDTMRFNGFGGGRQENQTLRRLMAPILRADYRLIETYRPRLGATVDCPVVGCLGDADPHVTLEAVGGWREVTNQGFDLRVFPGGDHFYLKAHREELLAIAVGILSDPG